MANLQERLISLQNERHALKKDIAAAVGVSVMGYYRYEKGEREPSLSILIALADFFDVSLDYLAGRSDNPNSHKLP